MLGSEQGRTYGIVIQSSSFWGDPEDEKQLWMGDSMAQELKSLPTVPE